MLSLEELGRLTNQPFACFHKVRKALHVTLHPRYLNNLELGLLDYFNKQINRWHPKLNGILANYGKLKLKSPHGMLMNEEAHIHLDVISDFWIFRPEIGSVLQGTVTKTSQKHVACLVHGVFNVPCYHPNNLGSIPWWGINAQVGRQVRFKVIKMDVSQKIPFILGELEKWGLDGNPVSRGEENLENPVEEIGPEHWDQVAGGSESQGEFSDTDSGIQSLPKRQKKEIKSTASTPNTIHPPQGSNIPLNLLPQKPLSNFQSTPKPPNVDDLIKSIQIPAQQVVLPTAISHPSTPTSTKANVANKTKKNTGEIVKRQCAFCDNIMPKKGMKNHLISAHFKEQLLAKIPSCAPGKSAPYQCPKCEKTQKDRTDILRHFANTHNELSNLCTEDQLQGRDVSNGSVTQKMDSGIDKKVSNALVAPIVKTEISSEAFLETTEKDVTTKVENTSPKKKKKEKKKENVTSFESFSQRNANASTLSNTSATPIRNVVAKMDIEENGDATTKSSMKKKKKKNKEKQKEIAQTNESGFKRQGESISPDDTEIMPKKKSKSSLEAIDCSTDINEVTHKKSKKKKKDKRKND